MYAEILAVGHELLMGEIVDSNSSYVARQLAGTGVTVRWMSHIGDDLDHLTEAFSRGLARSDIVISTGGLGPTSDDLTREAVARAVGEEPEVDPDLLEWLQGVFARRGIEMPDTNIKQATLIPSAKSIPNPTGTAPGWWVKHTVDGRERHAILLPGPPREISQMWTETVEPRLAEIVGAGVTVRRTLKTYGVTEGGMDEILSPLFGQQNPYLGIYAHADGIHLRIIARAETREAAAALADPMEAEIRRKVGHAIWGVDDDTPAGSAAGLLLERGETLAASEGATGGAVASMFNALAEGEAFFKGALIGPAFADGGSSAPANEQAALDAARSARQRTGATVGLSTTRVATDEDDAETGAVYIGMTSGTGEHVTAARYPRRSREWVMQRLATTAMVELAAALKAGRL